MKYFIFAMFFILWAPASSAQDFFVPGNAFSSAADKLKPIPASRTNYKQHRYKVIDGRVIALPDEIIPEQKTLEEASENKLVPPVEATHVEEVIPAPGPKAQPEEPQNIILTGTEKPSTPPLHEPAFLKPALLDDMEDENEEYAYEDEYEDEDEEDDQENTMFQSEPPVIQDFDSSQPTYKNRYKLYVDDLKTFQKTNKLPKNQDLESVLKKLSKPREVILFQGEVQ